MSLENIKMLVEQLPVLIMYIVPGYLVIWVMGFLLSRQIEKDKHIILKSIVVSYLLITIGDLILGIWGCGILESKLSKLSLFIAALAAGFLSAKIILSGCIPSFFRFINVSRSIHNNFFNDIVDFENGLWVTAYLPNDRMIYRGQIRKYEEKENSESSFIVLANYTQLNYEGEVLVENESNNNERVLINTKDVSRIDLHYHPNSKKLA